jgi:hypothetical protein
LQSRKGLFQLLQQAGINGLPKSLDRVSSWPAAFTMGLAPNSAALPFRVWATRLSRALSALFKARAGCAFHAENR